MITPDHGRPTASELLDAVIEHLESTLLPEVPAHQLYGLRVAIRALGVVRREIESVAADRPDTEGARGVDRRSLAAAIRSGRTGGAEVLEVVRADVMARLAVTDPDYAGRRSSSS